MGGSGIPVVTVFNKIDALADPTVATQLVAEWADSVAISALTGEGVADLLTKVHKMLHGRYRSIKALVPYDHAKLVENAYAFGRVTLKEYREDGVYIEAELVPELYGKLEQYAV